MREPAFWWRPPGLAATLLAPAAALYGTVAAGRMARAGARASVPVLCVGNFTLGGSGKTPAAIAIAERLKAHGHNTFFLSRGYGGSTVRPARVDEKMHDAADVGDEPLLLARTAPTIVAHDRVAGAELAEELGADAVVMDDGLQNPSLEKSLSIVVVDGRRGIGNGKVFPAGPLRAPLDAQFARAHALLIVGPGSGAANLAAAAAARKLPALRARIAPDPTALATLPKRVLAYAGIGDPEKFFDTVAAAGIEAPARRAFPDHHRYTATDQAELVALAEREKLTLLTTEKDLARMAGDEAVADLAARSRALPVRLRFEDESAIDRLLREKFPRKA